jgi:hypothetical protein
MLAQNKNKGRASQKRVLTLVLTPFVFQDPARLFCNDLVTDVAVSLVRGYNVKKQVLS